jgi:hypothetical protein
LRLTLAPGSSHFAQCLRYHLHPSADVVLLEFSVNDGHGNEGSTASIERIVRRVLHTRGGMDAGPSLLLVNWCARMQQHGNAAALPGQLLT